MMLAEDLRQAVLQAALQGKLTEQLETDSDVDEMLNNLKNEKEKMIADHIIGREKPYSAQAKLDYKPYDIPSAWRYERFGTIMINRDAERIPLSSSLRASKENLYDYYGASGVIDKTDGFLFDKELLLIGEDGANLLTRSTPIAFIASGKYWVNNHAHVVDVCGELNLRYICYYINSIDLSRYVTGTAQPKMNQSNMNAIWVPIPPIEEQQRIVDKINEVMPRIDEYEKMEKELEALKKMFPINMKDALLQAAMQGRLTKQLESDSGVDELLEAIQNEKEILISQKKIKKEKPFPEIEEEEIPFDIPDNWRWVRLGDISTYGQSKDKIISKDIEPNMWVLDLEDIEKDTGRIATKNKAENKKIAGDRIKFGKHDILYSKLRPYLMKILVAPEDGICTPEIVPFKLYGGMNVYYIMFILKSPFVNYAVNAETYGMKMPRVGTQTMLNMLIPIPPIEEQQRIVERLEALLPLCEDLKE